VVNFCHFVKKIENNLPKICYNCLHYEVVFQILYFHILNIAKTGTLIIYLFSFFVFKSNTKLLMKRDPEKRKKKKKTNVGTKTYFTILVRLNLTPSCLLELLTRCKKEQLPPILDI